MDTESLMKLIREVSSSKLTEFSYEEGNLKIFMGKEFSETINVPIKENNVVQQIGTDEIVNCEEGRIIKSPLVGTFYAASSEGAEPFVKEGDVIKKGQTVAIVEAMKLMNDIESEYEGTVNEILVQNGQSVEYGQPLFRLR